MIQKGKTYKIKDGQFKDQNYLVEGLWIEVTGKSWMVSDGNPAAMEYAMRTGLEGDTKFDDNVYYGHIGAFGKLIHADQIGEEVTIKER